MPRLRKRHLPHRIDYAPLARDTAEGDVFAAAVTDRPAYVEQKQRVTVDARPGSDTFGQQVMASAFVVVLPEDDIPPRTRVTLWKGTPRESTSEVIRSAFFEYPGAPSHVELWLE